MKNLIYLLALCTIFITGCQHDIDPDDLTYPPEIDETKAMVSQDMSAEEIQRELKIIRETPYPPYTINSGDIFRVRVYNEEELNNNSSASTVITPDGYLAVDLVGPVLVKDMTIVQATDEVRKRLSKFIKYPEVSLLPQTIQGKTATLLGAVRLPGAYQVSDTVRLSDFVALGGGFMTGILDDNTVDLADFNKSYIVRDGKMLPIDFNEAIIKGNQDYNIKVFPQDIVYIAKREDTRVIVMGEVKIPRVVNWHANLTFLDALANCGGVNDDYWGTALIIRRSSAPNGTMKVYKVDLSDVIGGRSRNFKLASGDIVYIPKDSLSEYNIYVRKIMPTAQLINLLMSPPAIWFGPK